MGPSCINSRDPSTAPSPAPEAGPPRLRAAFLALSLCWLGRNFLLENSRILPVRPRAWPGNLGGRDVLWQQRLPESLGHRSFPPPGQGHQTSCLLLDPWVLQTLGHKLWTSLGPQRN